MSAAGNLYGAQPGVASSSRSLHDDPTHADADYDDDEFDQLEDDDASDTAVGRGATGGGARAGPGPSTLAYRGEKKRAASPAGSNASLDSNAGTPAKKRKAHGFPRASTGGGAAGRYVPPPKPHYTVVRSANNSRANPHVIRIHPGVTDADESRWPSAEERRPSHKVDGRENWYECQPKDVGRHKSFREKLGDELSKLLNLRKSTSVRPRPISSRLRRRAPCLSCPDDFARVCAGATESWIVEDLPEHNLFTVHHTITSGKPRTDVYVFGEPASRFGSRRPASR